MKYVPPPLEDLIEFSKKLPSLYSSQNKNENENRTRLLGRLNSLVTAGKFDNNEIVKTMYLSVLIEGGLIQIEKEYFHWKFFNPNRSRMYQCIRGGLNETIQNSLNHESRLVLLWQSYKYLLNFPLELKQYEFFSHATEYLIFLKKALKFTLKQQTKHINHLLMEPPDLNVLKLNIKELHYDYQKNYMHNNKLSLFPYQSNDYMSMMKFIMLVYKSCECLYPTNHLVHQQTESEKLQAELTCNVLRGLVLFMLLNVKKGSKLHKEGLRIINAKEIEQISHLHRVTWLSALITHLNYVKGHHADLLKDWQKEGFSKLSDYENKIQSHLAAIQVEKNKPHRSKAYLNQAANYAVKYGIGLAIAQTMWDNALPMALAAGGVSSAITGPIGMVMFGTAGTIVASQLNSLVQEKLLPQTLANVYGQLLTGIGNALGNMTASMVTLTFSATKSSLASLLNFHNYLVNDNQECMQDFDWIQTLLELPEDLFDKEKKEIILKTRDLPNMAMVC